MKKGRKILAALVSAVVLITAFAGLERLVTPKYADGILEGAFIREYYDETTPHDVIMVGDCEVYENFSPVALWRDYGITSYIRGSAQQLVWQSYYLLEDTLRREKPKVVVYNVQSLVHNEPQREEYNRMTLDGMRWSASKVKSICASMTQEEQFLDYVFPILRYHDRITELEESDVTYYFKNRKITHNGYYMRVDQYPFEEPLAEEAPEDYTFGDNAMGYLERMTELCEKNDIRLVLVKAPSLSPVWYDEYDRQVREYADENNLLYINYLELADELGIDYGTDTYDGGLHMNLYGAEKLSAHLGRVLRDTCGLEDHRTDAGLSDVWGEKEQFYDQMIADQEQELEQFGEIVHY